MLSRKTTGHLSREAGQELKKSTKFSRILANAGRKWYGKTDKTMAFLAYRIETSIAEKKRRDG